MSIIGREREIRELRHLYDSNKAEFVAIYGRRRVGKTFLVDETLKGKITFRHAGLSPVEKESKKQPKGAAQALLLFPADVWLEREEMSCLLDGGFLHAGKTPGE